MGAGFFYLSLYKRAVGGGCFSGDPSPSSEVSAAAASPTSQCPDDDMVMSSHLLQLQSPLDRPTQKLLHHNDVTHFYQVERTLKPVPVRSTSPHLIDL